MQQSMLDNMKNHDNCDACGGVGQFLCCDACPNAFHFSCVEPPMNAADVEKLIGKWFCKECEYKQGKLIEIRSGGLFKQLIENVCTTNPKSYVLPEEIVNFFEGVSLDDDGDFINSTQFMSTRNKNAILGKSDFSTLKDRHGNFIQCYHCRKTAIRKTMIACDYCSLFWHLDCLNPPMTTPLNSTKKWKCPNHAENIIKFSRKKKYSEIISTNCIPCLSEGHFNIMISEEENRNDPNIKENSADSYINNIMTDTDIITSKDGIVYVVPEDAIQFKPEKGQDESATTSEVSTPVAFMQSPEHNKDEIDTWLKNIAQFHSGHHQKQQTILSLIRDITQATPNTYPKSSPIPTYLLEKHKKYKRIEQLLKKRNEEEIVSLICKNICDIAPSVQELSKTVLSRYEIQ